MEQKEGKPSEQGNTVSPTTEHPGTLGGGDSAEGEAKGPAGKTIKEGPPDGTGKQEDVPAEDGILDELQGKANELDEAKAESKEEAGGKGEAKAESKEEAGGKGEAKAELIKDDGKEKTAVASQEKADGKEETKSEPKEAEGKEETTLASDKQKAEPGAGEKATANDEAKAEPKEKTGVEEAKTESQKAIVRDEAKAEPKEADGKEEAESDAKEEVVSEAEERKLEAPQESLEGEAGGANEEQDQGVEREPQEGEVVVPSSPEEWPESPTEEGHSLSPDEVGPDAATSGQTSPSVSESSPSDVAQSPTETPSIEEKKKEKAPERRVPAPSRPRGPRAQNRKAIVDKFGGAASGPTALFRNPTAAGAAVGGVKNMLLEWCRAMTRKYEHVDIQNFSSSWSSGMAFCALIHKFFPDAFDYAELDPKQRRHNFTLAFSTAEKLADCAQLLEVDDMVRLAVPDSKCVYTYIQELYRSLVQKGLVKTKKK
ncbi:smoothelin-like protein 1 [Choloepus didactylus]|uniref:smoothelin-like protein 1 n=1 Tax=Choloepus didactylus TaxID=27675 RepID=UPI00189E4D50|nr:smoothelin-like protein 1 [Choloepus didactylus]